MWPQQQHSPHHHHRHRHHHHHHHHHHQQQQEQLKLQQQLQQQQQLQLQPLNYMRYHYQNTDQKNEHHGIVNGGNDTTQQQQQQQHQLQFQQQLQHHSRGSNTVDLPLSSNPRASRNMAEKQRRDNLNTNISTMASLVPTIVGCPRRLDKISILRLTTSYLRTDYTLGRGSSNFLPEKFKDMDIEDYILNNLTGRTGFVLIVTSAGKIVYVSQQVERHLGHSQKEMTGQSLYHYVFPDDHKELTKNITPDDSQPIVSSLISDGDNSSSSTSSASCSNSQRSSPDPTNVERKPFVKQRREFKLRMSQRATSRRETIQYECLNVTGVVKLADACENPQRRPRTKETSTSNDIIFVGFFWFPKKRPLTELCMTDANKEEYVTRHLIDGRIIYCDHRISLVAGYMSEEVSGMSAFKYMHKDDVRWTMIGLRQMYDRAEPCGSSCYRLLSKTGRFIYLRTQGYLEYDKDTQSVESFVCVNTLVSEEEGIEFVKEMKLRFSATVSGLARNAIIEKQCLSLDVGGMSDKESTVEGSLEDESQLEDAITHLISDLPSPTITEDCLSQSQNRQFAIATTTTTTLLTHNLPPVPLQPNKIRIKKFDNNFSIPPDKSNIVVRQEPSNEMKGESSSQAVIASGNKSIVDPNIKKKDILLSVEDEKKNFEDRDNASSLSPGKSSNTKEIIVGHVKGIRRENRNNESTTKIVQAPSSLMKINIDSFASNINETDNKDLTKSNSPSTTKFKRLSNEENIDDATHNKKRKNEKKHNTVTKLRHEEQQQQPQQHQQQEELPQNVSYLRCRAIINNRQFSTLNEYDSYDQTHDQPVQFLSIDSQIQDSNVEYQELDASMPLMVPEMVDDKQFEDLQEIDKDSLLTANLEENPDYALQIGDLLLDLDDKSFDDNILLQRIIYNNEQWNDKYRTRMQIGNYMDTQDPQFEKLASDLDDPLKAKRKNSTKLQDEINNTQMHNIFDFVLTHEYINNNIQYNAKKNIGV